MCSIPPRAAALGEEKENGTGRSCSCPFLSQPLPCSPCRRPAGSGDIPGPAAGSPNPSLPFHPAVPHCLIAMEELGEVTLCAVSRKKRLLASVAQARAPL